MAPKTATAPPYATPTSSPNDRPEESATGSLRVDGAAVPAARFALSPAEIIDDLRDAGMTNAHIGRAIGVDSSTVSAIYKTPTVFRRLTALHSHLFTFCGGGGA